MHRRKKKREKHYLFYVIAILGYFAITALFAVLAGNYIASITHTGVIAKLLTLGVFFITSWVFMYIFLKHNKLI